jgi:hypothetical protein
MAFEHKSDDEIIISNEQFWETPPCDRHPAVCIDIVPVGEEEQEYTDKKTGVTTRKDVPKVFLVFQVWPEDGSRDSEGRPFLIDNKFTASLAPAAILRLKLERWRGRMVAGKVEDRPFTNEELKGFNLAKLKGVPCWLSLIPNGNFVNVSDIEPFVDDSGKPITPAPTPDLTAYQRRTYKKKAKGEKAATTQSNGQQTPASSGSSQDANKSAWIPF